MKKHLGIALCGALLIIGDKSFSSEANPSAGINLLNRLVQDRIIGNESSRLFTSVPALPGSNGPVSLPVRQPAGTPENIDGAQHEESAAQIDDLTNKLNDALAQKNELQNELAFLRAAADTRPDDAALTAGSDRQENIALTEDLRKAGLEIASLRKQMADLQAQKQLPAKSETPGATRRIAINDAASKDVRASYAVGAWYGDSAPQETSKFSSIGRKLDLEAFSQGFHDRINNHLQLSQNKLDAELDGIARLLDTAMLSENQKQSRAIIEKVAKEQGAVKTPDGAVYKVLDSGKKPMATDQSNIQFELDEALGTGEVLASGEKGSSHVKDLPPLFQAVVKKLGVGGAAKMYVPGEQVYGESGIPGVVPPGALSIMTIKILGIK